MPLTPLHSAEWLEFIATPPRLTPSHKWGAKLHTMTASLTFTAAGVGTATMFRLPAGKIRVFPDLCRVVCPAGVSTSDLHIGYAAYTNEAGTAVVASDNAFGDNIDVGGGAIDAAWTLPAVGYWDANSRNGIDIQLMFDTANSPAAGECFLLCTYQTAQ